MQQILKLCPFCGAEGKFMHIFDNPDKCMVGCRACDASIDGVFQNEAEAAERWNMRVVPADIASLQAENKRLTGELKEAQSIADDYKSTIGIASAKIDEWKSSYAALQKNYHTVLDAYEGTKAELAALKGRIERGEWVRVPCKVGDTVWVISNCDGVGRSLDGTMYSLDGSPGTATGYYCAYDGREDECPLAAGRDECDEEGFAVFEDTVSHISVQIGDEYEEPSIYIGLSHVSNYKDDKIYSTQEQARAALKP